MARHYCSSCKLIVNLLADLIGMQQLPGPQPLASFSHSQARSMFGPQLLLPDTYIIRIGSGEGGAEAGSTPSSSHIPVCPYSHQLHINLFLLTSCSADFRPSKSSSLYKRFSQFSQLHKVKSQ